MSRVRHGDYQKRGKHNHIHDKGVTSVLRASDPAVPLMDSTKHSSKQNEPMRASMDSFISLYRSYATAPTSTSIKGGLEDVQNLWAPTINKKSATRRESNNNNNNNRMISPKVAPIRVLRVTAPEEDREFSPVVKRERVPHRPARGNAPPYLFPPVSTESSRSRGATPSQTNQHSRGSSTNNSNSATFTGMVPVKNQNAFQNSSVPSINPSVTRYTQQQQQQQQEEVPRNVMYNRDSPTLNKKNGIVLPVEKSLTPTIDSRSDRVDGHSNPNASKVSAATTVLHAPQYTSDMKRESQDSFSGKGSIPSQSTSLSGVLPFPSNAAHISTTTVTRTVRKVKYIPVEEEYIESEEDEEEPIDNVVPPSTSETYTRVGGNTWKPSNWQSNRSPENNGDGQLSPYKIGGQGTPMHPSTPQFPRTNSGLSTVSILSSNKWARRCYMMSPIQASPEIYPTQAPIILPRGESIPNGANFLLQRHHQSVEIGRRMWGQYFKNSSSNTDSNNTEPRPLLTPLGTNTNTTNTSGNTSSHNTNGGLNGTINHESGSKRRNNRLPPSNENVECPQSTLPNSNRFQDITGYRQLSSSMRSAASCATVTQAITVDDGNGSPDDVDLAKKPENKRPRRVIIADSDWDEEGEYDEYEEEEYEGDEEEYEEDDEEYEEEAYDLAMPASPTLTVAARNVAGQDSIVPSEREELDSGSLGTN